MNPSMDPSLDPTINPTMNPSMDPSLDPTINPTISPSIDPTVDPTINPTMSPSVDPTLDPTFDPTMSPSTEPTVDPTVNPTLDPSTMPSNSPSHSAPTQAPTVTSPPLLQSSESGSENGFEEKNDNGGSIGIIVIILSCVVVGLGFSIVIYRWSSNEIEKGNVNVELGEKHSPTIKASLKQDLSELTILDVSSAVSMGGATLEEGNEIPMS